MNSPITVNQIMQAKRYLLFHKQKRSVEWLNELTDLARLTYFYGIKHKDVNSIL